MADVKHLITRWRALKDELKGETAKLDAAREAARQHEQTENDAAQLWANQRGTIQQTLDDVLSQVQRREHETAAIVTETQQLEAKVSDRRVKQQSQVVILQTKRDLVEKEMNAVREKEREHKERLDAFHEARDHGKAQLNAALRRLEEQIPAAESQHASAMQQLKTRLDELKEARLGEAKQFAVKKALADRASKAELRDVLQVEARASAKTRDEAASLLRSQPKSLQSCLRDAQQLRQRIAAI